jgi:hypothetical protein
MKRFKTLFKGFVAAVAILALGAPIQTQASQGCYVSVPQACYQAPITVGQCNGQDMKAYCTPLTTSMAAVGGYSSGQLHSTSWTITCYFTCWFYNCEDEYDEFPHNYNTPASGAIGSSCSTRS